MYIQTDEENNDESSLGGNQNCTTKRWECRSTTGTFNIRACIFTKLHMIILNT